MAYLLGLALLVLIGALIVAVSYMYFVKDYWIEVDDMSTKQLVEKYKSLPVEKQDLIKDIVDE
jgi:uncharacterized membrane protein